MIRQLIPYADTGYFSKALIDYLQKNEALKNFYDHEPSIANVPAVIEKKSTSFRNRGLLFSVLKKQNSDYWNEATFSPARKNIEALQSESTYTITTAHQPNLFLGPLYFVYKIVSAINLAKKFQQQYPSYQFVPVFWMGSEDHDAEELNHILFLNEKIEWQTDQSGAFGRMKTHSLQNEITRIAERMGNSTNAEMVSHLLNESYLNHETIAGATRHAVIHLFAKHGLVVIDGDDADLKKEFASIAEEEFTHQLSYKLLLESNKQFGQYYEPQVEPRENNLFYLGETVRQRFVKSDTGWKVLNTDLHFSEEEILKLLKTEPEKFSPNVVLRPVYQELCLPNIAFIGGGSEVVYWLQLKPLFDAYQVPYPMVWLRNSVLWIDSVVSKKMNKLGIPATKFFHPADLIVREYLQGSDGFSTEKTKQEISIPFDRLKGEAAEIDSTLQATVEAEKVKALKSFSMLEEKIIRAMKRKEEEAVSKIQMIKQKLFPEKSLQERGDSFLTFYYKYGPSFLQTLLDELDPAELQMTILSEEG